MESQRTTGEEPRRRGPRPLVTRKLLLEAGERVVKARSAGEQGLGGALDVQLSDVLASASQLLAEAGVPRRGPVAPPVLYKHWPSFEDYLQDLVPRVWPAGNLDLSNLQSGADLATAVASHALADRKQMQNVRLYYSLLGLSRSDVVRDSLRGVYQDYDEKIIPVLRQALRRAGRAPRPNLGPDGVKLIAAALTALSEGFMARSLVDPEATAADELWSESAKAIVFGMTGEFKNQSINSAESPNIDSP